MFLRRLLHPLVILACAASAAHAQQGLSLTGNESFGSAVKSGGAMLGIFYDLKQNQKRQPVPMAEPTRVMAQFLDSGWDEDVLSGYFRATRPLYATEVMIPVIDAKTAPEAFGLAGVVQPSRWFVIYKAQVSPPEDGTYRFVGIADDVLAVAVDGKTELVSNYTNWPNLSRWKESSPAENIRCWAGEMKRGDWFTCRKTDIIDLDILIGEIPGGRFGASLFIEKKGQTYPMVQVPRFGPTPALPVFQLKKKEIQKSEETEKNLPYTLLHVPWTCHP
ncbi:MAG: hypothetical protein V4689_09995 [Verrucomicrobiota bacterium]